MLFATLFKKNKAQSSFAGDNCGDALWPFTPGPGMEPSLQYWTTGQCQSA